MFSPKIVVIGGGTAGLIASDVAKRACASSKVTVLDEEPFTYRRPALISVIRGDVKRRKEISIFPQSYLSSLNVKTRAGVRVIDIDSSNNLIKCINSQGNMDIVDYDQLILATGGYATKPMLEGVTKPGVFALRTFHDASLIRRLAKKASSATVVGAGFVGLLTAEALAKRGLNVNLLARSRILRMVLEADLAKTVQYTAERYGIRVLTGVSIEEIGGNDRVKWVETSVGKIYSDLVVFATGVKPRIELAKAAGIARGESGIIVNNRMQTSIENIYAAGDCVEVTELITKRNTYVPIGSLAAAEGQIAGSNSAGRLIESEGFLRAQDEDFFNLYIVSIGQTTESAREANLEAEVIDIMPSSLHVLKGVKGLQIKLVVNASNNDVIGAQLIANKHNLSAKGYPSMLLDFVRGKTNCKEALKNFERNYRTFSDYILWKHLAMDYYAYPP